MRRHEGLYQAVEPRRSRSRGGGDDIPPGGGRGRARAGGPAGRLRQNDSTAKFYLFGPDTEAPIGRTSRPERGRHEPGGDLRSCCEDYDRRPGRRRTPGTEEPERARGAQATARARPTARGAQGAAGHQWSSRPSAADQDLGPDALLPYVIEDDSELSGSDIKNPEQELDPNTNAADRHDRVHRQGPGRVRVRHQADRPARPSALRGSRPSRFQRFAITLDNQIVSLATIDYHREPEGIDGRTGAQINGIGTLEETQDLAESLRIGALPIELKLISKTQVSATLGQQALDQGLLAGGVGLALTLLFLLVFYRVLGVSRRSRSSPTGSSCSPW